MLCVITRAAFSKRLYCCRSVLHSYAWAIPVLLGAGPATSAILSPFHAFIFARPDNTIGEQCCVLPKDHQQQGLESSHLVVIWEAFTLTLVVNMADLLYKIPRYKRSRVTSEDSGPLEFC